VITSPHAKLTLPLMVCLAALAAQAAEQRPNIVLIVADDLGYGDLGCYGQEKIATPEIDKLAAEGLRFTQHYAGSSVCAPSRASLLTGQHTGRVWIRGNDDLKLRPAPEDPTVFEALKAAGYETAMIGKSGLSGDVDDAEHPGTKGVDHFFGFVNHQLAHHYFPPTLVRNGERVEYPGNSKHEGDRYSCDLFFEDVMAFLDGEREKPFFLHYATQLPHASLYAPEEWKARYRGRFPEIPLEGQSHYRNEPEPRTTFAAMVSRLDWEVGQIVAKLREKGLAENTLVIFCSDNGPPKLAGYDAAFFGSAGPFRGLKRDLTEGGIRVPLIAWWPGKTAAGGVTDHVSAFWDVLPTLCDAAGADTPDGVDGISFLPTLVGDSGSQRKHERLYWEFFEGGGSRAALLDGRWKALQLGVKKNPDGPVQIFDLATDVREEQELSAQRPDLVERAKSVFREEHRPSPHFSWIPKAAAQ
jgi:arylsulfatase A-like enzyme